MKPLTIEELKALKVGEFVYLTNGNKQYGTYAKKISSSNCKKFVYETIDTIDDFLYLHYSKDWLAWKNKEQAEAKGEIVELQPYTIKDTLRGAVIEWEVVTKDHIVCDTYLEAEARLAELKGENR